MTIDVDRTTLAHAAADAKRASSSQTDWAHLAYTPGSLSVSGWDWDGAITTSTTMEASGGDSPWTATVDPSALDRFAAAADRRVCIEVERKGDRVDRVTLTDGTRRITLSSSGVDKPKRKTGDTLCTITADAADLAAALAHTRHIGSQVQFGINGIHLDTEDMALVSTDGRVLDIAPIPSAQLDGEWPTRVLIPAEWAAAASRTLSSESGEVRLTATAMTIEVEAGNVRHVGRTLDGEFPDWRVTLPDPSRFRFEVQVEPDDLSNALRFVRPDERTHAVVLRSDGPETVVLSASGHGQRAITRLDGYTSGDPQIGLAHSYSSDIARAPSRLCLRWAAPLSPVHVTCEDSPLYWIVMPMRLD